MKCHLVHHHQSIRTICALHKLLIEHFFLRLIVIQNFANYKRNLVWNIRTKHCHTEPFDIFFVYGCLPNFGQVGCLAYCDKR